MASSRLLKQAPDPILTLGVEGDVLSLNDAAVRLLGPARGNQLRVVLDLFAPTARDAVGPILQRARGGETISQLETVMLAVDGSAREAAISLAPVRDDEDAIVGLTMIVRDISERKQTERELQAGEVRYRLLVEHMLNGVAYCRMIYQNGSPYDFVYLAVNPAFERLTGLRNVVGKRVTEVIPGIRETDASLLEIYGRVARTGIPEQFETYLEALGEWFSVSVYRSAPEHFVAVFDVITNRKKAELSVRAARDTFRHMVERSPFGIYVVDAELCLVQVSEGAQRVFENVRPLIGRDLTEVLRLIWQEPFATEAIARFRHTLESGEPYRAASTVEQRADSGATEAYDWKIERIALPDARPGVVCHFYDLSERLSYEEHIRLLLREVNHRSKNLLAVVQAIARQTSLASPTDFLTSFSDRVAALSASHDLLVESQWQGVSLNDLVRAEIGRFQGFVGGRIKISGPHLRLSPKAAQTIGMALHELTTNAGKYGALSNDVGSVEVAWRLDRGGRALRLTWIERGGPVVEPASRHGFGTTLICDVPRSTLQADVQLQLDRTGLSWSLEALAERVLEAGLDAGPFAGAIATQGPALARTRSV